MTDAELPMTLLDKLSTVLMYCSSAPEAARLPIDLLLTELQADAGKILSKDDSPLAAEYDDCFEGITNMDTSTKSTILIAAMIGLRQVYNKVSSSAMDKFAAAEDFKEKATKEEVSAILDAIRGKIMKKPGATPDDNTFR